MPIQSDDVLCRFIRPRKKNWSSRDNRPKSAAFKQQCLSVWHEGRVVAQKAQLRDLQIDSLAGTGQATHTAGDYQQLARKAGETKSGNLRVSFKWNPNVNPPWQRWRDAHLEVVTPNAKALRSVLTEFRRLLALNTRTAIAPPSLDDA